MSGAGMDVLVVAGAGAATCRLPSPCSVVTQAVRGEHVHWQAVVTVETSAVVTVVSVVTSEHRQ